MKRTIINTLLGVATTGFAMLSYAQPFTLHNNTSFYLTSIINNGPCSTILGKEGVTNPHSINTIKEGTINVACMMNSKNCKVEVYASNNCKGQKLGTVDFNTKSGINSITDETGSPTNITGNGFVANVDQMLFDLKSPLLTLQGLNNG